jgi:hypothetical protein
MQEHGLNNDGHGLATIDDVALMGHTDRHGDGGG